MSGAQIPVLTYCNVIHTSGIECRQDTGEHQWCSGVIFVDHMLVVFQWLDVAGNLYVDRLQPALFHPAASTLCPKWTPNQFRGMNLHRAPSWFFCPDKLLEDELALFDSLRGYMLRICTTERHSKTICSSFVRGWHTNRLGRSWEECIDEGRALSTNATMVKDLRPFDVDAFTAAYCIRTSLTARKVEVQNG